MVLRNSPCQGTQNTGCGTCLCYGRQSTLTPAVGSRPLLPERQEVESGSIYSVSRLCRTPFSSFHTVSQEDIQAVLPSLGVACFTETASQSSGSKPVGRSMSNKLRCGAIQLAWGPHIDPRVCGGQSPAAWTLSLVVRPCAPLESESCRYSQL